MRKLLITLVSIVILIILLFPYLLSAPPLKQILIATIEHKINAKISIDTIRFSWMGPQELKGIHISNAEIDGRIEQVVLKTALWKIADQPYSLAVSNGDFQVHGANASGSIEQIHLSVEGSSVNGSGVTSFNSKPGTFSIQGTALTEEQYELTFFADLMPTDPIDCLLGAKGDLNGMLGATFAITGSIANHSGNGSFNAELSSQTAKASIQSIFTPKYFALEAPLKITTPLPPSIVKKLAQKRLALLDPVSLYVANDSFFFPRPFSLSKLSIKSASLALGRIATPKPGGMGALSTFLQAPQLANPGPLELCLTPADFSLNEGLLTLERVDGLVAKSVHLCCWGKVNLLKSRLNMILGVPGDTLSKTLLAPNTSPEFCLQIPVSGSYENPDFDTKTAAIQLASLVAASQAEQVGGNLGALGSLAGKVVSRVSQPEQTPAQRYQIPCK